MYDLLEILKYILPSLVIFITVYFMIKMFIERENRWQSIDIKKSQQEVIIPLRFQAYERMALYLERIIPNNLVMRIPHTTLSVPQFQSALLKTIRSEFEHNLSQQIYISSDCWKLIKNAKEEMIKLVNISVSKVKDTDPAIELTKVFLQEYTKLKTSPIQEAMDLIKKEVQKLF